MSVFYHRDNVIFTEFPVIKRSVVQEDLFDAMMMSNITTLICSRRMGKTTEAGDIFIAKAIPELYGYKGSNPETPMRHGISFICCAPMSTNLYDRFCGAKDGAFLHAFGGQKVLGGNNLDNAYVKLPDDFYDWLIVNMKDRTDIEKKWFFGDEEKKTPPIIVQFPLPELEGQLFVKLFKNNIEKNKNSQNANAICKGTLFNGVSVSLVGANENFGSYIRGNAIDHAWAEEIGQWKENYIANDAIQAIVDRNGSVVRTLTPPSTSGHIDPKKHWTYRDVVLPTIEMDNFTKHEFINGVHYYISKNKQKKLVERKINGYKKTVEEEVSSINTTVIGKFSECYSYIYNGVNSLFYVTQQLKEKVIPKAILDERTKLPKKNEIGVFLYELEYTGEVFNSGQIDMDTWKREYEMSYEGVSKYKIFTNFGNHNILPETYIENLKDKPKIIGFDKGMADVDTDKQIVIGDGSPTMAIFMANIGNNQWVIYDEKLLEFDKTIVGGFLLDNATKGIPTVYDRVLQDTKDKSGSIRNNDISEIIRLYPKLSVRHAKGIYNKCLIPCIKLPEMDRYFRLNKMFEISGQINRADHPMNPNKNGAYLYITENCIHSIKYFNSHAWKMDKNKDYILDKNNNRTAEKIMNEPFDCVSYVIDTFNGYNKTSRVSNKEMIMEIWNDTRYKSIEEIEEQNVNQRYATFFTKPRFAFKPNRMVW